MKPPRQDSQLCLVNWEDCTLPVSSQSVYKFGKDGSEANDAHEITAISNTDSPL
jgi:hypothetical protein